MTPTRRITPEPERRDESQSSDSEDGPGKEYEVKEILDDNADDVVFHQFRVRWMGYSEDHDCWVKDDVMQCPEKLAVYWGLHPERHKQYLARRVGRFGEAEHAPVDRARNQNPDQDHEGQGPNQKRKRRSCTIS